MSDVAEVQVVSFLQSFLSQVKHDVHSSVIGRSIREVMNSHFWLLFRISCIKISKAALSIFISFEKPPWPSDADTKLMLVELKTAYESLKDCAGTLRSDQGDCLLTSVSVTVKSIQTCLIEFLSKLLPSIQNTRTPVDLTAINLLLRECEQVEKLPKDNFQAVVDVLETTDNLISDIVDELTEEMKNQINTKRSNDQGIHTEDVWSESEFNVVNNALIMCKTFRRMTLKSMMFVKEKLPKDTSAQFLDQLADASMELSPHADEFISCIYPPLSDSDHILSDLSNLVNAFFNYLTVFEKCPNLEEVDINLSRNARERIHLSHEKIKTFMVSYDVNGISDLTISDS